MPTQQMHPLSAIDSPFASESIQDILEQVVDATQLLLPQCTGVSLLLWNSDSERFEVSATTVGQQSVQVPIHRIRQTSGATRWIVEQKLPLVVHDIRNDPFGANQMLIDYGFQAYVGVPLFVEDEAVGVLYALYANPISASAPELEMMEAAVRLAALAIGKSKQSAELLQYAMIDDITQVLRRGYFDAQAAHGVDVARQVGHTVAALMLDIDNFKSVNDTYGHQTGDVVLYQICQICREMLRPIDLIGRYGGDEIAIFLPGTDGADALLIADSLRSAIEHVPFETRRGSVHIQVSLGIADLAGGYESAPDLLRAADEALYRAKRAGGNQVRSSQ